MEIGKFKGKYRIASSRLRWYDYGSNGLYFVTICTKEKIHYFGSIEETRDCASNYLQETEIGRIANEYLLSIPEHYPFVILDEFIVMPNHLHAIIVINKNEAYVWKPNTFGIQSRNLAAIIRGFKSSVKKYANDNNIDFYWQARFHDHIISNEKTLLAVRNYIKTNLQNWSRDKGNEQGLKM